MSSTCALPNSRSTLQRSIGAFLVALLATVGWTATALAQTPGTSASVAFEEESSIVIDGQLDDWVNFPATVTVDGPMPSDDPGTNGRLRWQVAADPNTIYFAATITDSTIIAGQNDGAFWMEDSFELYLNLSDNLAATTYAEAMSQIRLTAVDIGATNPDALTLTGIGLDELDISGFVFETNEGWGTEIAIDVSEQYVPMTGARFGLQVQANGSSGVGRDLKLSWSAADVADTSFEDPSVFAQGVFVTAAVPADVTTSETEVDTANNAANDAANGAPETVGAGAANGGIEQAQEVESLVEGGPAVVTADEQRRSLFIAAIASSIAVFVGGLWFERKRRADEVRHAENRKAKAKAAAAAAGVAEPLSEADIDNVGEEEFEALLESILDDNAPTDGYE